MSSLKNKGVSQFGKEIRPHKVNINPGSGEYDDNKDFIKDTIPSFKFGKTGKSVINANLGSLVDNPGSNRYKVSYKQV